MSGIDLTDVGGHPHWVEESVRFSDTDLVGHVNNVAYAAYVESGRVAYGMALAQEAFEDPGRLKVVLRKVEIDFLAEAFFPGRLRVGSRLVGLGRTSYTIGTGVFDGDRCVATSVGVLVAVGPDGPAPIEGRAREVMAAALP